MSNQTCFHCSDDIIGRGIRYEDKAFCCNGCKTVYQLLSQNDLGSFYTLEQNAGTKPTKSNQHKYAFLEVQEIRQKFIDFEDEKTVHVTLHLPKIHCSSCIYLLENIAKIEQAVQSCQVNFSKRKATIVYNKNQTSLAELSLLLDKIGYAPNYSSQKEIDSKRNYTYLYKLGIAGFAFGSIMLWSFPEYLGIESDNPEFRKFTSYLSFIVSLPVLFYSANEYLISAFKSLRFGSINLDVPISLGIIALYAQSCYNIFSGLGPGYMDSFAGFIFFLLIGKWFQSKTYESLSFERDYTSYFPVAITRIHNNKEEIVEIDELKIGDHILVRNEEVIPCDVELFSESTKIDYSFVTGESDFIEKKRGEFIYAGGKLVGKITEFVVQKESSRSHLTQLWNDVKTEKNFRKKQTDKLSILFLIGVICIALFTGIYWGLNGSERLTEVVVSVLIVACPCALALSKPFTYGNTMRLLGRKGLYLKNSSVIESINDITTIVFDKTGTLTTGNWDNIEFKEGELSSQEMKSILLLANSSTHPMSNGIARMLKRTLDSTDIEEELVDFHEVSGQGVSAVIGGHRFSLGSAIFIGYEQMKKESETCSFVSIDGSFMGKFVFHSELREGIDQLILKLQKKYQIHVLSGDRNTDLSMLQNIIPIEKNINFRQTPRDKNNYILALQQNNEKVLMIGDGLNDSGALSTADVGIAVSEDVFRFTPSSDAIIKASKLNILNKFLHASNSAKATLKICYLFSILYNFIGLSFAVTGNLTPLIAAILMPISSMSIVFLSTSITLLKKW